MFAGLRFQNNLQDGVPLRYACLACLLGGFDNMETSLKTAW